MPVEEPGKEGIFANPQYKPQTVEEQKRGLFANPSYSTSGLGGAPTGGDNAGRAEVLAGKGVGPGGVPIGKTNGNPTISFDTSTLGKQDWRVRVSVAKGSKVLYDAPQPGMMQPLITTDGVIFPYVPSVTVSHAAKYNSQPLTHSNYNNYFYEGSEVQEISITADFTVQTLSEAAYFLASLYFFRAATKMFYGNSGQYQGSPPPIVYLDGYGAHYLPHVSCVVTRFSHTMPADVDYMEVPIAGGASTGSGTVSETNKSQGGSSNIAATRVPTVSQFTLALQPVYSRNLQANFDFDAFARGDLIVGQNRKIGYL
jgi:hypothetical protein